MPPAASSGRRKPIYRREKQARKRALLGTAYTHSGDLRDCSERGSTSPSTTASPSAVPLGRGRGNGKRTYIFHRNRAFVPVYLCLQRGGGAVSLDEENSRISMISSLVINIIDIIGNSIFIFGFGMGVAGAALSTLLSRFCAMAFLLVRLSVKDSELRLRLSQHDPGSFRHQENTLHRLAVLL